MTITVAIVGRPNVGKSTLFNRLVGKRLALVDDTPGVTRDRREGEGRLGDLTFRVIDTAGFEDARGDELAARMQAQTARAVAEAEVALFLIDARTGPTPLDAEMAAQLRRQPTPIIGIANKCEGNAGEPGRMEAYGLGLGELIPLSGEHGEGMADLYDALAPFVDAAAADEQCETEQEDKAAASILQLAIVGRPNVGKSTLINRLIGDDRLVTGPEAGITRDAIAVPWSFEGRPLKLIDTAGLRRRAKVADHLEGMSAADTLRAVRYAQVVAIVLDGTLGLEKQDLTIARTVVDEGRAPLIVVNKWDLIEDRRGCLTRLAERLEDSLPQVRGIRVVPVSARSGEGLKKLLPEVFAIHEVWDRHLPTARLNQWLAAITFRHQPPAPEGRPIRIRYMTQAKTRPPSFVLFVNRPEDLPESYLRFLANGLRDDFGLAGVPLRLSTKRGRNPFADQRK